MVCLLLYAYNVAIQASRIDLFSYTQASMFVQRKRMRATSDAPRHLTRHVSSLAAMQRGDAAMALDAMVVDLSDEPDSKTIISATIARRGPSVGTSWSEERKHSRWSGSGPRHVGSQRTRSWAVDGFANRRMDERDDARMPYLYFAAISSCIAIMSVSRLQPAP